MTSISDVMEQKEESQYVSAISAQVKGKGKAVDRDVQLDGETEITIPTPSPERAVGPLDGGASSARPPQTLGEEKDSETGKFANEYHLKAIEWPDPLSGEVKQLKVITQNENGPCPLHALCNVLILRGDIEIRPYDRPSVTYEFLVELLGDYLLRLIAPGEAEIKVTNGELYNGQQQPQQQSNGKSENSKPLPPILQPSLHDYHHTLNAALSIIPSLQAGLDVNVRFNSIHGFEPTAELSIFDVFNVDLVHGWVVDPQDEEAWDVVVGKCGSYNRAVECVVRGDDLSKGLVVESFGEAGVGSIAHGNSVGTFNADAKDALIVSHFLNSTATQLTYHGLLTLAEALPSGHICVFFRNNHFSTLYKNPATSSLYVLVTDAGFVNQRSVVWESLTDVDQSASEFLNGLFFKSDLAGSDYLDVVDEHNSDIVGGGDQDYALALSLQQQEEEKEAQYRRQHNQILQQTQQQSQKRQEQEQQNRKGNRTLLAFRLDQRKQSNQPQQQSNNQTDSAAQSSSGSTITTASSVEKEKRKKEKKKNDCIIS
ncbi:hypothetical protein G9A89_022668 [Geosiphon pyriformis]|nr:hypothetical protein G9A89_022668 [Geosiphon pyriformis]